MTTGGVGASLTMYGLPGQQVLLSAFRCSKVNDGQFGQGCEMDKFFMSSRQLANWGLCK